MNGIRKALIHSNKILLEKKEVKEPISEYTSLPTLDVSAAIIELQQKSSDLIEAETAVKWAARAIASYTLSSRSADRTVQILRLSEGDDYRKEAYEHSGEINDECKLLNYLRGEVEKARDACLAQITKSPWQY